MALPKVAAAARTLNDVGVSLTTYYFHKIPSDEPAARRLFTFARRMGVQTIVSEHEPELLDMVGKLCDEFRINVVIHNHTQKLSPVYWNPSNVLEVLQKRPRRIGVSGDIGFWIRTGVKPAEAMDLLKNRVRNLSRSRNGKHNATGP